MPEVIVTPVRRCSDAQLVALFFDHEHQTLDAIDYVMDSHAGEHWASQNLCLSPRVSFKLKETC